MTAREYNAFDEIFSMVFDAAAAHESGASPSSSDVGVGKDGIDDLIGKLRKYPKRLKWSTELDDILDRQKEVINLFTTDQELLEWATDAVFGESQRYEAAARKAVSEAAASGIKGELPMLQPPTYPHLVALVMHAFREKFNDPHLALSMFEHARNLSTASYVFGCSSQAYHELIETRWKCFQDLKGVHEALQEMEVNGVMVSSRTRQLVERIRRDIGNRHLWVEESEIGSSEIWKILADIERISTRGLDKRVSRIGVKKSPTTEDMKWDEWKAADNQVEDEWGFNEWNAQPRHELGRGKRPFGLSGVKRNRSAEVGETSVDEWEAADKGDNRLNHRTRPSQRLAGGGRGSGFGLRSLDTEDPFSDRVRDAKWDEQKRAAVKGDQKHWDDSLTEDTSSNRVRDAKWDGRQGAAAKADQKDELRFDQWDDILKQDFASGGKQLELGEREWRMNTKEPPTIFTEDAKWDEGEFIDENWNFGQQDAGPRQNFTQDPKTYRRS